MTGANAAARRASGSRTYRAGVALAAISSLLNVWTTIVRDDGSGLGAFMLVLAAVVGGFAGWFRPAAMARAMLGVALMQVLLGIGIATAPSTLATSDGLVRAVVFNGVFTVLWLASAASFRAAAKAHQEPGWRA